MRRLLKVGLLGFVVVVMALLVVSVIVAQEEEHPLGHEGPVSIPTPASHKPLPPAIPTVILKEFLHKQALSQSFFNGRSIAFDGTNLWTNFAPSWNPETKIYKHDTNGNLLQVVNIGVGVGALAFNPGTGKLYGGNYEFGKSGRVYEIDQGIGTASLLFTFNFPSSDNCFSQTPGFIDGLEYRPDTNTLYLSDDGGKTVYQTNLSGGVISSFPMSDTAGHCNSGIAYDGAGLWLVDVLNQQILHTDLNGNPDKVLFTPGYFPEDTEYDDKTFAPKCALWTNEATFGTPRIRAYEVPCAGIEVDVTVTIDRVRTLPGGCGDVVGEPDFFPKVKIGTQQFTKPVISDNADLFPNWVFSTTVLTQDGKVPVRIEVFDSDVAFDDQCDINPATDKQSLEITYDALSSKFSGDSTEGDKLVTNSAGADPDAAEICFGISKGDHLSVCQIRPVQVVFDADVDEDGVIDLVKGKPSAVIAPITVHGNPVLSAPLSFKFFMDALKEFEFLKTLENLAKRGYMGELFFTPSTSGDHELMVEAEQSDRISRVTERIMVKDTRKITIPYLRINNCDSSTKCWNDPVTRYSSTLSESNDAIVTLFPISGEMFDGPDSGIVMTGDSSTKQKGKTKSGEIITEGFANDMRKAYLNAKDKFPDLETAVTIVPDGYFEYHGLVGWEGAAILGDLTRSAFVTEGHAHATPQEVAHGYRLDHRFTPPDGYFIKEGAGEFIPSGAVNFMCSGSPQCVHDLPPGIWSDTFSYNFLFDKLRANKADPEILVMSGFLFKNGVVELKEWFKLDQGTVTELTPGSYSVIISDINGTLLIEILFEAPFKIAGVITDEVDFTPFTFAVPFPQDAFAVTIAMEGIPLISVEPHSKLLRDAILSVPDHGFDKLPKQRRNALLNKVDALEEMLKNKDGNGATNKLKNDIRKHVVDWLTDYQEEQPIQYTKDELIELIDDLIIRIQNA